MLAHINLSVALETTPQILQAVALLAVTPGGTGRGSGGNGSVLPSGGVQGVEAVEVQTPAIPPRLYNTICRHLQMAFIARILPTSCLQSDYNTGTQEHQASGLSFAIARMRQSIWHKGHCIYLCVPSAKKTKKYITINTTVFTRFLDRKGLGLSTFKLNKN